VDLEKDLQVIVVDGQALHIVGLGDAMDDVVGPMVNKTVRVGVVRGGKSLRFGDIELDD